MCEVYCSVQAGRGRMGPLSQVKSSPACQIGSSTAAQYEHNGITSGCVIDQLHLIAAPYVVRKGKGRKTLM
eukprot:1157677-Pelagomonas_calceolata.AAC.3